MSPTTDRLTVSDWEAELVRRRTPRAAGAEQAGLDELWQRFRDISARTRDHRQSAWIGRPEFLPLRKLSDHALELTRLAHQELSRYDAAAGEAAPLGLLDLLLAEDQSRLGEIDRQLSLIHQHLLLAELLQPLMAPLLKADGLSVVKFQAIIEQLAESSHIEDLPSNVLWPGLSLPDILETEGGMSGWFYGPAIHRARWTAALLGLLPETLPYSSTMLILPALLADCGLLALAAGESKSKPRPPMIGSMEYQRHSEVGAALIAAMRDVSPLSALLAGQHHERINGSGFPRRLKDQELREPMRTFVVLVRWSELLLQPTSAATPADALAAAAMTLWRETLHGAFNAQTVNGVMAAIQPELPAAVKEAVYNGTRLLLHPAHPPAGPHQQMIVSTPSARRFMNTPQHRTPISRAS